MRALVNSRILMAHYFIPTKAVYMSAFIVSTRYCVVQQSLCLLHEVSDAASWAASCSRRSKARIDDVLVICRPIHLVSSNRVWNNRWRKTSAFCFSAYEMFLAITWNRMRNRHRGHYMRHGICCFCKIEHSQISFDIALPALVRFR